MHPQTIASRLGSLIEENNALKAELKQANLAIEALNICIKQDDEREAELQELFLKLLGDMNLAVDRFDSFYESGHLSVVDNSIDLVESVRSLTSRAWRHAASRGLFLPRPETVNFPA